ncbi:lysosomal aspartic protease-like [Homalodisca vitripennis]|uniref:lysosomal aspartic protease-like n=1 Tax=Homalodisca vitripennis TaxID=197043 RepID=UPI001EE9E148|nr:lysosomal aspartic protease-like [Homalodisca vitripennis]
METGLEKLLRQEADIKLIEGIYEMARQGAEGSKLVLKDGKFVPTNDTLPLFKYFDSEYYGLVNIGKPGKTFKMIMDTAWAYSWVISSECPRTSLPCAVHQSYNHKTSSTYQPDGREFNVSNEFMGYMSKDVFLVGQMNTTGQGFAELTHLPWIYTMYDSDGTIGLGFQELAHNATPFFYNLIRQNRLKEPIFSFYINSLVLEKKKMVKSGTFSRYQQMINSMVNETQRLPGEDLCFFGGIDPKHNKTAFSTINVNSNVYWQFPVTKISVVMSKKSQVDVCKNGCNALADTSTNGIMGPPAEIKVINQLIGAERIFFSDRYLIPCTQEYKGPKIVFNINNQEYMIKGRDYIQKMSYSGITICLSAFRPATGLANNTWTLGGAFFYQYYTAFDVINRQILIADAA